MRRLNTAVVCLVAGLIATSCFWCSVATAQDNVLRPYWTGPVWGAFTDAGPDSIEGWKGEINVPIGVRLTRPVNVGGYDVTLRAKFRWTAKAYLGAESEPLRDSGYEWFPVVHVAPDTADGFFRYFEGGPYHKSNGDDGTVSRSMNAGMGEAAFAWTKWGVAFDAYVSFWYTYEYGSNTESLADAISLVGDFGAKVLVRGSVDVFQLALDLGPDWQKVLAYVPLNDFYEFGFFTEIHFGEYNSFLDPIASQTVFKGGLALEPPRL